MTSHTGTGFLTANVFPLVAEQYKGAKVFVGTTKSDEHIIVDLAPDKIWPESSSTATTYSS